MRFFAPLYIRPQDFWAIRLALYKNISPIRTTFPYYGPLTIVPVRADAVIKMQSFDSNFLGNPYPLNDLAALDGSILPWAYSETGEQDFTAGRSGLAPFTTRYDQYILGNIYIPKALRSGDILLCSRRYPSRQRGNNDMR